MVATVIAVPSPITKVAAMPAQNSPCASANTRTRMAPEHGRMPTVNDRAETSQPAAGTGKLRGLGTVGMPAMLVVDMVVIAVLRVRMPVVVTGNSMRSGMLMTMMPVIAMMVRGMSVMVMMPRCVRQRRRQQWRGSAEG